MKNRRKENRLANYDYSRNGLYFVTVCTKDREKYLSKVECVGDGVLDVPHRKPNVILKEYGKITKNVIDEINDYYNHIEIKKYVIMPDHIHMVIFKYDENDVMGTSRTPSPTNAVIPALISTMKRFANKRIGFNIWQRSYHDRIIRSEEEFLEICDYIDNNPVNWANNKFNQNKWR